MYLHVQADNPWYNYYLTNVSISSLYFCECVSRGLRVQSSFCDIMFWTIFALARVWEAVNVYKVVSLRFDVKGWLLTLAFSVRSLVFVVYLFDETFHLMFMRILLRTCMSVISEIRCKMKLFHTVNKFVC